MAEIINRKKALSVSPLKASQTMGAALAFLGFARSMPLMHGSQGCTAFAKVFFVRHYREPIPLQTTAMDQISSVMGADDNVIESLRVISEKNSPALIGLVTTGLAETQGCDVNGAVSQFRQNHSQFCDTEVVTVNSPDFSGCFESGFALAVKQIISALVPDTKAAEDKERKAGLRANQVNVLCHANLTPGDLEFVVESIESFGLRPLLIPDLSSSLDGHLAAEIFNPLTNGGLPIDELKTAGQSAATLVIGESLADAADCLHERTGVPQYRFAHLMTMEAVDNWLLRLAEISQQPVKERWQKRRQQLQDAMLDTHFMIGATRCSFAGDADLLSGFYALLSSMGSELVAAVVPARTKTLESLPIESVQVGDLEDLESASAQQRSQLLIGNSHTVESAKRLGIPVLRAGFPQFDYLGGFQRCWSGYRGIQQTLFDLANIFAAHHKEIPAYHSIYSRTEDCSVMQITGDH